MTTSFSPAQLDRFRREAKQLSRDLSITHSEALDRIAVQHGFKNWSLLSRHSFVASAISTAAGTNRSRYYLHGDVVEGEPDKCYCARCDVLWGLDHFLPTSWHKDGNDVERFLSSFNAWNKLSTSEKGRSYRPVGAPNVLQKAAEAAQAAHERSRSPFHRWLEGQIGRADPVGDLAVDAFRDKNFPVSASSRRELEDYLRPHGSHAVEALLEAWHDHKPTPRKTLAQALAERLDISVFEAEKLQDVEPEPLTGHSDEMVYGYLFDFTYDASPLLAAKLRKKLGFLQLKVEPSFFDDIHYPW